MERNAYQLSYLAGYLDGEGCFYLANAKNIKRAKISVVCETTYRPTIKTLHKMFGGCFVYCKRKNKSNWRPTYRWQVVSNDAKNVIDSLLPFLVEKKKQALVLLEFQKTLGNKRYKEIPLKILNKRNKLAKMVKMPKGRL